MERGVVAQLSGIMGGAGGYAAPSFNGERNNMSNSYTTVSALIFALVAIAHFVRLVRGWRVEIGPYNVSLNVSWVAVVVAALIAIWGFMQLD